MSKTTIKKRKKKDLQAFISPDYLKLLAEYSKGTYKEYKKPPERLIKKVAPDIKKNAGIRSKRFLEDDFKFPKIPEESRKTTKVETPKDRRKRPSNETKNSSIQEYTPPPKTPSEGDSEGEKDNFKINLLPRKKEEKTVVDHLLDLTLRKTKMVGRVSSREFRDEDEELPPPTDFHWEIPASYPLKPVRIRHPNNQNEWITLTDEETREFWHIVSWIEYYGQDYFEAGLYKIQKDIIAHFVRYRWVVDEVFRSAGKTFVAEFLLAYQIVEGNRNGRYFIVGEVKSKTIDRVMFCRNILSSPRIIRDYGFIIDQGGRKHKSKDRASSFNVIRTKEFVEATLTGLSWMDQTMQGAHYDGGIFDDVWSIKLQNTRGAKEKFLAWYNSFQFTLEQCDWFIMLRTRKGVNDLYADLDQRYEWTKFTTPLVLKWPPKDSYEIYQDPESGRWKVRILDEERFKQHKLYDSCPTPMKRYGYKDPKDPSKGFKIGPKYTMEDCLLLDHKDHVVFFREMQNQPFVPEGKLFKREHLHLYDRENKEEDPIVDMFYKQIRSVDKIMIMDPAKGEQSDYNVLGVLGYYRDKYFLMDAWVWRGDPEKREQILRKAIEKYPGTDIYIESDYDQLMIVKELRKRLKGVNILPFESKGKGQKYQDLYSEHPNSKKRAKMGKIHDALEFPWNHDQIYLHKRLPLLKEPDDSGGGYAATLLHQITTFPDCELFDYIDMLAMGVIVLREYAIPPILGLAV